MSIARIPTFFDIFLCSTKSRESRKQKADENPQLPEAISLLGERRRRGGRERREERGESPAQGSPPPPPPPEE